MVCIEIYRPADELATLTKEIKKNDAPARSVSTPEAYGKIATRRSTAINADLDSSVILKAKKQSVIGETINLADRISRLSMYQPYKEEIHPAPEVEHPPIDVFQS